MTTSMRLPAIFAIALTIPISGYAQISTQDLNTQYPNDLVNTLLGGGEGIHSISNVTYTGDNSAAGTFSGGTGIVGFESGIILSSGNIADVVGPNDSDSTTTDFGLPGDADLQTLIPPIQTKDAAVLEFYFIPTASVITFKYVFTSEEYNEYGNSDFNDVFGFFVNGDNVALLPDGVTPVSINTVNGGTPFGVNAQNPDFFINNDCDDGGCPINIEGDGLTVVLTAVAEVNAGQVNHIKLAISDVGDAALDSWVFVKASSFRIDDVPPSCELTLKGINANGEQYIEITASDNESGLFEIFVTKDINATVTGHLAGTDFPVGTHDPVIVTATKIIQDQTAVVELMVSDYAGNVTVCDPVITLEIRENGQPVTNTFTDIPEVESNISIKNGVPGINNLEITVNGNKYEVAGLKDDEERFLDVSEYMVEGDNNIIALTAKGKPGGSALIVISD